MTVATLPDCGESFDLDAFPLLRGGHSDNGFHGECCMVELSNRAAACVPLYRKKYGAPDKFEAGHPSISPVIQRFCIAFNDGIQEDATRTRLLRPYVLKILGTKTTERDEETRAWLATDWLVRVQAPAWLALAGRTEIADKLRNLPPLTSAKLALGVQSVLDQARSEAAAARDAARDAAWAAARDAARDAAWAAARDAAWAAVRDAARDAAWAAAWAAARDAARAAAGKALAPTVTELQASALTLLDAMIAVGAKPSRPTPAKRSSRKRTK